MAPTKSHPMLQMHTGCAFRLQTPPLAHPVRGLIPDRTCNHPHPPSFRRRPESRTHAYYSTPRLSVAARPVPITVALVPACAGTDWGAGGHSPLPLPVRRAGSMIRAFNRSARPTAAHRKPHFVIPAQAGIQNPRHYSNHAPNAAARPVPLSHAALQAACAGTTGWTAGRSSAACAGTTGWTDRYALIRCLAGATLEHPFCTNAASPRSPTASPTFVIPAKAGIQNPRLLLQHAPSVCCTSGART